jgi:hypothetical protein
MNRFTKLVRLSNHLIISIALAVIPVLAVVMPVSAEDVAIPLRFPWQSGESRINGGYTYSCGTHVGKDAYAIDFQAALDRPIVAAAAGVVHTADETKEITNPDGSKSTVLTGYGHYVWIAHANGYVSLYAHLNSFASNINNQTVAAGAVIGFAGGSGGHDVHLHFSLRKNATTQLNGEAARPEPMGGYRNFGNYGLHDAHTNEQGNTVCYDGGASQSYSVNTNPPGGWWQGPTPDDNSIMMPGTPVNIGAHGIDNNNGGLEKINVTVYEPGRGWQLARTTPFAPGTAEGNATGSYIMPDKEYILLSFDVYSRNGAYHKAPSGLRKVCSMWATPPCEHRDGDGDMGGIVGGGTTCTIPPTTSSATSGALPGNQGWWRSSVTLTFNVDSLCNSGFQTYYKINGGGQNTYNGPVNLSQEGIYNIEYYSVDTLGNTESTQSLVVKIDWTPPVTAGTATAPRDINGLFRDNVTVGLNGTDNLSGVESNQYSMNGTDFTTLAGNNNTFLISGNGVFRALYRSQDVAGNLETNKDSGPIIINKYVIFANATGQSLRFLAGTTINISGDIFTNGNTKIVNNGGMGSVLGTTFRTVGAASGNTISGNVNTTIPTIQTGGPTVPMLSYPLSLYKSLATVVFPADLKMSSVSSSLNSIIYVEGNVELDDVNLSGPLSIVATGTITDYTTDSTIQTNDPYNGVLLFAGQDVDVRSTGGRNLGLMYAPNGTVYVRATNLTLNGSLVGNNVEVNGATTFNLAYNAAFAPSTYNLPLTAMGLIAPATTPPALPSVPAQNKPLNNATGQAKTKLTVSWYSSTGAVGYQMQISTSPSFATTVHNMSYLDTYAKVNLSGNTTYYWRVRAINQGGLGAWSTVRNFKTAL